MENIILSLLMLKNMTVYELKISIEKSMNTICSNSMGSIQAALKKLLAAGRIDVSEFEEKGVVKKEYRIMPSGKEQFQQWITTPMDWNKAKNMEEGKFLFMGMLPRETRMQQLRLLIEELKKELLSFKQMEYIVTLTQDTIIETNILRLQTEPVLTDYILSVSKAETIEGTVKEICAYQLHMLQYALERLETDIKFFSSIYEKEQKGDIDE